MSTCRTNLLMFLFLYLVVNRFFSILLWLCAKKCVQLFIILYFSIIWNIRLYWRYSLSKIQIWFSKLKSISSKNTFLDGTEKTTSSPSIQVQLNDFIFRPQSTYGVSVNSVDLETMWGSCEILACLDELLYFSAF